MKNFGFTSLKDLPLIDDIEAVVGSEAETAEDFSADPVTEGQLKIQF